MNPKRIALTLFVALVGASAAACSKCGPGNCAGCCDATGACQAAANEHCGQNGAVCASCLGLQQCIQGACGMPGGGGGSGSGGSGSGSGTATGTSTSTGTTGTSASTGSSGTSGSCAVQGASCAGASCCAGLECANGICTVPGGTTGGGCNPACGHGEKCAAGTCVCDAPTCTGSYSCNGADRCIQGQCVQGSQACQSFSDCCSGVCANQVCDPCAGMGGSCAGGARCCTGYLCYQDSCMACEPDGAGCTLAAQCCSNICDQGTCKACQPAGGVCHYSSDCCSGNVCLNGQCGAGCTIGGTAYATGAANPQNACQVCQPQTSQTSWTTLSGTACAGICVDTSTDRNNCRTCGTVCAGGASCQSGTCACTATGNTVCGGSCIDPNTDSNNCGGCGTVCTAPTSCQAGRCACPASGNIVCSGVCIDPNTDSNNCGGCGTVCSTPSTCVQGRCRCANGGMVCSGACVNGSCVTTLAGNGTSGFADGTGGSNGTAKFWEPAGVAVDASGNVYVADEWNNRIRKIDPSGNVTTLAGNGARGFADGTGGANGTAQFNLPYGVAVDASENVYVADEGNNRIRKIDPSGNVTTLAGNGTAGFADGTGGPSGTAKFWGPDGVAVDAAGNVYVADQDNNRIRKIDTNGNVTTLAGNGTWGFADGTGGANGTAMFSRASGVTVDAAGNVYVADQYNNRIRKVDPSGNVTTLAGNGTGSFADGSGGANGTAEFYYPNGVAVDAAGNVYVGDEYNNRIRKIGPSGNVTTLAGNGTNGFADGTGGANGTAEFYHPYGVAVDAAGNVYVGDYGNNRIRQVVQPTSSSSGGTDGGTPDAGTPDAGSAGPSNDTCASPAPITAGQTVSGDTTGATNDYDPGSGGCTGYSESGPDLVYSFTPSMTRQYTITLTPQSSSYDAAVYVMSTCPLASTSISCVAGKDANGGGGTETLTVPLNSGTPYYIVVDSFGSTTGPFTLSVQ